MPNVKVALANHLQLEIAQELHHEDLLSWIKRYAASFRAVYEEKIKDMSDEEIERLDNELKEVLLNPNSLKDHKKLKEFVDDVDKKTHSKSDSSH